MIGDNVQRHEDVALLPWKATLAALQASPPVAPPARALPVDQRSLADYVRAAVRAEGET